MAGSLFSILDKFLFTRKKVGLALSGGVARGFAHVGVLNVLRRNKIPVDYLAATSSGAIVGAFFAAGLDPHYMEEICRNIAWGHVFKISFGVFSPNSGVELERIISDYLGKKEFKDLNIPYAVVAQDIKSAEEIILNTGKVARAVRASATFPGIFKPIEIEGRALMDGGIVNNLPAGVVKEMGASFVIGVDVMPGGVISKVPDNGFQQFGRALDLAIHSLSQKGRDICDILIEPHIDEDIWHMDFGKYERLIKAGEEAAEAKVKQIKRALNL